MQVLEQPGSCFFTYENLDCLLLPESMEMPGGGEVVLRPIAGEPMIQHVYRLALRSKAAEVWIATDDERIEILFLATLSRYPRDDELDRMRTFVQETETPAEGISTAFADILWALLNSAEFTVNH